MTPSGVGGQCQDASCSNCGYCKWVVTQGGQQHNITINIGCPGSQCNAEVRSPFSTVGSALASAFGFQIPVGLVEDQYESGVAVTGAGLDINSKGSGWTGGHLTLTNHSSKPLTTVRVTFKILSSAGPTLQFSEVIDGYLTESPLAVGESMEMETGTTGSFNEKIAGVSASISYVEFADGTKAGTNVSLVSDQLTKDRRQAIAFAKSMLEQMKKGTPQSNIKALVEGPAAATPGIRTAKSICLAAMEKGGDDALLIELKKLATLKMPM